MSFIFNSKSDPSVFEETFKKLGIDIYEDIDADYRKFLFEVNGMKVAKGYNVDLPIDRIDNRFITFFCLYGCGTGNENFEILFMNFEVASDLLIEGKKLVIGDDGGGNFYILLDQGLGFVIYYWDRTHLHDSYLKMEDIAEIEGCGNLYFISNSFDELYNILCKNLCPTI